MADSINALNGQGMSLQFEKFAQLAASASKGSSAVRFLGYDGTATVRDVIVTTSDKVGKIGRSVSVKEANNTTRAIFRQSVAAMFGGEDHIPDTVKTAMKLGDYGKGKPLTARRILAVRAAVEDALKSFPLERPNISAPSANVSSANARQPGGAPGLLSAHDVLGMGYAPGELKKLNDVAQMFQKATGCPAADAQQAALDPKSDARRLFDYGGQFTSSTENFAKGLQLIKDFGEWFKGYIECDDNKTALYHVDERDTLSVEKFVFEEIGCNTKFSLDTPDKADLFGPKKNNAMQFIRNKMMEGLSGTLSGISPDKRSVVFAIAEALREETSSTKSGAFKRVSMLVSRTLANLPKAADLVYSGKLDRKTVFNALFPDLKKIGLSASSTNKEIDYGIYAFERFDGEMDELEGDDDPVAMAKYNVLKAKNYQIQVMINQSGASIQDCKTAAEEKRRLKMAEGMSNITADFHYSHGFSDAGRNQFVADIHRPVMPSYNDKPAVTKENNVFRYEFDGQKYVSKSTEQPGDRHNEEIADAIEKFCNSKVHPRQTNAVFFALAQGGLAPQYELSPTGYVGSDHGPITSALTKDEETGTITIKYSNPEGSPVKFSWTATVDVDGKVTATPVKVGE